MKKYNNKDIKSAVIDSLSIRQVLIKLGLAPKGGNYATIKNKISKLNLNTDHFSGQGWAKNKKLGPKRPIEDFLTNKFFIQSYKLKNKLFDEKIKEEICENCKRKDWMDKKIPLELHHIDGNNENNNLSNLQILCPNCHAITDNYRGKKLKKV